MDQAQDDTKHLVAGSDLRFEDRGVHALKGLPDEWRLSPPPGLITAAGPAEEDDRCAGW